MLKKMFVLFLRDLKVNTRDFLSLYILVLPIVFGIAINLLTPGINDTTINLALLKGDDEAMVSYLKNFAKVSVYDTVEALEERVGRRDDVFAIVPDGEGYYVLQQGNELKELAEFATLMLTFYQEDVQIADSTATIYDFGRSVPPLKKMLVNIIMMFSAVLGGMLIAMNIIEEKVQGTIRAIHLSPVSRNAYILGKSMMGAFVPLYGSIALLLITGFKNIDWMQMLVLVSVSTLISILVGFIGGINNKSVMDAAGSVKMLFLPLAVAVVAVELLSDKWQRFFYWIPFYWTYKGTDAILNYSAKWQTTLLYGVIVVAISGVVYVVLMPRIKKGLE